MGEWLLSIVFALTPPILATLGDNPNHSPSNRPGGFTPGIKIVGGGLDWEKHQL